LVTIKVITQESWNILSISTRNQCTSIYLLSTDYLYSICHLHYCSHLYRLTIRIRCHDGIENSDFSKKKLLQLASFINSKHDESLGKLFFLKHKGSMHRTAINLQCKTENTDNGFNELSF